MTLESMLCDRSSWLACGVLAVGLAACTAEKVPARSAAETVPSASSQAPDGGRTMSDQGTTVRLSEEIMRECRFPSAPQELPQFDVDKSSLRPRGRDVLADVANCLKDGPLQNRTITIIGRADARGTEAHNQELGASRADATRNYLMEKGVAANKLLVISRGEQGAVGTDEASMALDRRVDLVLGDATERTSLTEIPPANARRPESANHNASPYADQVEGGPASGKLIGSSGPGTDSVPGK